VSYKIKFIDKYTGQQRVHKYSGSVSGAEGWARGLSRDNNNCRAEAVHVADGPYDWSGKETHIITVGDDK